VLASFKYLLEFVLAFGTLHSQHNFLCCLSLLVEHRLGLATKTLLFAIITPLTLRGKRGLSCFVLGDLMSRVLLAFGAICVPRFRYVHHLCGLNTWKERPEGGGERNVQATLGPKKKLLFSLT